MTGTAAIQNEDLHDTLVRQRQQFFRTAVEL